MFPLLILSLKIIDDEIKKPKVLILKDEEVQKLCADNKMVVVYRCSQYNTASFQPFMESQSLFDSSIKFAVVFDNCLPTLQFYSNNNLLVAYSPVFNEQTMLLCMNLALHPNITELTTRNEVLSYLGQTDFTIVGPITDSAKIIDLAFKHTSFKSFCGYVFATKSVLESFGLIKGQYGVYHKIDDEIIPFDASSENINKAFKPKFDFMTFDEMKNSSKLIFLLLRENIHHNHTEFMADLSEKYNQFEYSFAQGDDITKIGQFTHLYPPFTYNARILILNVSGGYFYNSEDYIGENIRNQYFETEKWKETAERYINAVISMNATKTYKSEYAPRTSSGSLTKVVGVTYKEFLNTTNSDVIMYYARDNQSCRKIFDYYVAFANKIGEKCKIGFIDVDQNAVEGGLHVSENEAPKVAFFKKGKTEPVFMNEDINIDSLMKFYNDQKNDEL